MALMNIDLAVRELPPELTAVPNPAVPNPAKPHRRVAGGLAANLLRQGVLGYALSLGVTWFIAAQSFQLPDTLAFGVVAVVGAWLLYSFAALPAYERARSFKPAIRFVEVLGAAILVAVIANADNTITVRNAMIALVAAPIVSAASAVLHRQLLLRCTPTILVGQVDSVTRIAQRWQGRSDVNIVATCSWQSPHGLASASAESDDDAFAQVVQEVLAAVSENGATSVVIASSHAFANPVLRHLAWSLQRAEVECLVIADMSDHVEYLRPRRVGDQIALSLRAPNDHLMSLVLKSVFDRFAAGLALVLLSPLLLLIAASVRLGSRGPAIFRQERTGRDGMPFTIYKFRTMEVDAEHRLAELRALNEGAGPLFKLSNDPRITPRGRFLRRTSLDELPQLFNVLNGDMSLVGPRPALESETSQYSQWVWRRLHVKPGLTGLWQVSGRSALSWEDSIRMDLQYVNNWNLRLDMAILARTMRAVLAGDGAL